MTFPRMRKSDGPVYLALLLILVAYVVSVIRLHPTNFFGLFEDDSIYFSSAKALAQGQGYVLPSVPGTPPATKYPILYPLILSSGLEMESLVSGQPFRSGRGHGHLRNRLRDSRIFLLRRLQFFNGLETLCLTAFCALHPLVFFLAETFFPICHSQPSLSWRWFWPTRLSIQMPAMELLRYVVWSPD